MGQHSAVGARDQVVAAGVQGGAQVVADGVQVGDAFLHLDQLLLALAPAGRRRRACRAGAGQLEQVGDLVQGEPEPLRRLDHPQHRDRLRSGTAGARRGSGPARRAGRGARSSAASRMFTPAAAATWPRPQPGRLGSRVRSRSSAPRRRSARATSAASTSAYAAGTSTSNATSPGSTVVTPKVKNEQQRSPGRPARCVRSATAVVAVSSNRRGWARPARSTAAWSANRSSNSATRSGRSTVGSVHASTAPSRR